MVRKFLVAFCLCAVALPSFAKGAGRDAVIYLGPAAAVKADGKSPESALSTLQDALSLAQDKFKEGSVNVTIRVLPGRYVAQSATTPGAAPGGSLTIAAVEDAGRPVFDGAGADLTWLTVTGRVQQPANLRISGFRIQNYLTAITLNGSRNKLNNAVSKVVIRNNFFEAIGQQKRGAGKPSTAVIRLVNSDDNSIVNNRFIDFRNVEKCSLLHGIYLAHNSTGNLVKDNQFENGCGDAIRFRDGSGGNQVEANHFTDAWATTPISDWYCDASGRDDCTKQSGECPSLDNTLVRNQLTARKLADKGLTEEFGALSPKHCTVAPGARRFIRR